MTADRSGISQPGAGEYRDPENRTTKHLDRYAQRHERYGGDVDRQWEALADHLSEAHGCGTFWNDGSMTVADLLAEHEAQHEEDN